MSAAARRLLAAIGEGVSVAAYQIQRSVRMRPSAVSGFRRTWTAGGNQRVFTISAWVKRGNQNAGHIFGSADDNTAASTSVGFRFAGDAIEIYDYTSAFRMQLVTAAVFRDTTAHMHLLLAVDTNQATATDRVKLYVNGVQTTVFTTASYPAINTSLSINFNGKMHSVGANANQGTNTISSTFDGLISDFHFIDGIQALPTDFAAIDPSTGVWTPKAYAGSYGATGFRLDFVDNSGSTAATIGADRSGNGFNFTPVNVSVSAGVTNDSWVDTPTIYGTDNGLGGEVRGNYCTLWPLPGSGTMNISDGGARASTSSGLSTALGSMQVPASGNWYWEARLNTAPSDALILGFSASQSGMNGYTIYFDGTKFVNNVQSAYTSALAINDVIGFHLNAGTLTLYKQAGGAGAFASLGVLVSGLTGDFAAIIMDGSSGASSHVDVAAAFGQRAFANPSPPAGAKCICAANLPAPAIMLPGQYFDVSLRAGTGAAFNVTGKTFQPDIVWSKNLSSALDHVLYDSGRGATKQLVPDSAAAETIELQGLTSFNGDGFSGGSLAALNTSGNSMADWLWKKGALPGVDIVPYVGNGANRTIAHALGAAPALMLVKHRGVGATSWTIYHRKQHANPGNGSLALEQTAGFAGSATPWNNTVPTSSVFSLGTAPAVNDNGANLVNLLFAEVPGFSRIDSYTGNNNADGPFIYCGFRPRWIMLKRTDSTGDWLIYDTARAPLNVTRRYVQANSAAAENSIDTMDILANGFKIRSTNTAINGAAGNYIFVAFAEAPFKFARAR